MSEAPPDRPALPPGEGDTRLGRAPAPGALATPDATQLLAHPLQTEEETHFWDYCGVLLRHRWTVITFLLVSVIVTTICTFTTRPTFTAAATLRIEKDEPRILKFEEVVKADAQQDYYQTQFKVLQSRTLANRVIGLLGLDQHAEFVRPDEEDGWFATAQAWARERLVQWVPVPPPPGPQGEGEDLMLESPLTRAFEGRLSVEPVRNARLVKVAFQSHYPDLAARVANTLAEAFIAQSLDQKVEATRYATQFLAKQMEEARSKLETAEVSLNRFVEKNDILFLGSPDKAGDREDLVTQQLGVLSDALLKARTDRIAKESLVQQALSQGVESLPAVLQSPLVAKLKEEMVNREGEYRKLGQTFKPDYPRMQRMEQGTAEVKRQLAVETNRVVEGLDADYRAALRTERQIDKTMAEQQGAVRQLGGKMAEHRLLRRDVDTNRELYTVLLTRLKETQIASALVTSNITVVDRAEVPLSPTSPKKALNLLLGGMIGLLGGVGLAFFFEYLDTNIKDAKEIETLLRVPTIGIVPSQESLEGRRARRDRRLAEESGVSGPFALIAHTEMGSVLAEAFRNLRTSLLYSAPDHPPKTLMVTSLQPEDGKTSMATNLAITLSQLDGEVLLVDGDMRRPNLHQLLDVPQAPGLSTVLTGQAELPAVLKQTSIPNLYLIPAGVTPLNPAELLASARLRQIVEVLGDRFSHIVFDAPPLMGVSDSLILAPRLQGVVLVLRHGRAGRDASQRAIQLLASVRARVLGVVLNAVDVAESGSGYYGYYGYHGYGYGAPREPRA